MKQAKPDTSPVAVQKTYEFVLWLLPKVEKFPRSYRFTIGERLTAGGLDLLLELVQAAYAKDKPRHLEAASRKVNAVRYLLRLAKDLKMLPMEGYAYSSERLEEIGRMVGGWQKAAVER
jgi:hypothetical protein